MVPARPRCPAIPSRGPDAGTTSHRVSSVLPGAWSIDVNLAFDGMGEVTRARPASTYRSTTVASACSGDLVRLTSNPGQQARHPDRLLARWLEVALRSARRRTPTGPATCMSSARCGHLTDQGSGVEATIARASLRRLNPANAGSRQRRLRTRRELVAGRDTGRLLGLRPDRRRLRQRRGLRRRRRRRRSDARWHRDSTNMTSAHWSPDGEWIATISTIQALRRPRRLARPARRHRRSSDHGHDRLVLRHVVAGLVMAPVPGRRRRWRWAVHRQADGSGYSRLLTVDSEYDLPLVQLGPQAGQAP